MKHRAVVFDLFGTLVESPVSARYYSVLEAMAADVGAPPDDFAREWNDSYSLRACGMSIEQNVVYICDLLSLEPPADGPARAVSRRLALAREAFLLREGAISTLRAIKRSGRRTALLTACTGEVPDLWRTCPAASLVDDAFFSCALGVAKPDPRAFRAVVDELCLEPAACLFVDDLPVNVAAARTLGMDAVLIESAETGAQADVQTLAQVVPRLR